MNHLLNNVLYYKENVLKYNEFLHLIIDILLVVMNSIIIYKYFF